MKYATKFMPGLISTFIAILFLNISCIAQGDKILKVESISMNKICNEWDGQWQGITVASDGNVYFGTSTHSRSHGAGFHRYNPTTGEHKILAEDMTVICSEGDTESEQGKIHSPIVEHDGWLYFTTHLSNYWPEGIEKYPGAHVIGYELKTEKFRDFGIVKPRYSIYSAINVDPERNLLYVFVAPFLDELVEKDGAHLYSIDIKSGEKRDLGQLTDGQRGTSFWFFVQDNGNVWFTLWKAFRVYENDKGNLYCYDVKSDKIVTYDDVLPSGKLVNGKAIEDPADLRNEAWTFAEALPGRKQCLFAMGNNAGRDERLWIFDPSKDIYSGEAFKPIASIGSTFLETALGGDRVYFVQYASLDDQRSHTAEADRDKELSELDFNTSFHIRSVSINPNGKNTIIDHGKIVDQDGREPRMINSLAADKDGNVYIMGSWHIKNYKEASMQILFSEYPGENIYKLMDRGEFFAVAKTKKK